jgi:putative Mg2+ transporter-C (MgtC) family protein
LISELDIVLRLIASCVFGGMVGYERQSHNKSAGLRTHILVSLGSCLVMILSININIGITGSTNWDATRLAAQVISGIGFLGAGSIMANRQGFTVSGLTTAVSLWVMAAIGLATGSGYWIAASATTLLVYVTLTLLSRIEKRITISTPTACTRFFVITALKKPGQVGKIGACFGEAGINIRDIHSSDNDDEHHLDIAVQVDIPKNITSSEVVTKLLTIEGILAVKIE